jgi:hypothetical protein
VKYVLLAMLDPNRSYEGCVPLVILELSSGAYARTLRGVRPVA